MEIQLQNRTFFPSIGGVEQYLESVGKVLEGRGHQIKVLCSNHSRNLPKKETHNNFNILRHTPYLPLPSYRLRKLEHFISLNSSKTELVISRHPYYCLASTNVLNVPVLFVLAAAWPTIMSYALRGQATKHFAYKLLLQKKEYQIEREAIIRSTQPVVLSRMRARELAEYYKLSLSRFKVIPPGVDLDRFKPRRRDEKLIESLNLPFKAKVVLFVGRLSAEKNVPNLLEAFKQTKHQQAYLLIAGDGPQAGELKRMAEKLNISDRVRFAGWREDVERLYSISDLLALPSIYEGFGHVYLEAMACGLPCIGIKPDYPSVKVATEEIISNGRDGFIVPNFVSEIAEKMDILLLNEEIRKEMGESAREKAEYYTWEKHVDKLLENFI
ncbi:MAG TPA: glycosyltransferase family 4 protein [Thermoplasmata archaeon]|nr:glycosyltransferase family 4 protein [Thermoplasmata archaeon]HIH98763.1 glycosyltransferase family 4 protein [Thermoplasmata archaeon]